MPSINGTIEKMAPPEALDQLGDVIPRLIEAMVKATDGELLFAKMDIKDAYWRSYHLRYRWNCANHSLSSSQ